MCVNQILPMTKKTFLRLIAVFFLLILGVYYYPTSSPDFFNLYPHKDKISKSYKVFLKKDTKAIIINTVKWNYYTGGNGEKTILFLHGMGGAYDIWWQQIQEIEKDFKVISYTLPEEINSLKGVTEGIKAILSREKVTAFSAVGSSMGGYITQYLVQIMPERLEKVVFGNTFPPNDIILKENNKTAKIFPNLPEILIVKLGDKKLKEEIVPAANNSELLQAFLPSLPFSKKQFINRYAIVIDKFSINSTDNLIKSIPKLIIESDNDPMVNKDLRDAIKNLYTEAGVFTFHKAGHFPYINEAKAYNRILEDFFKD